MRRKGIVTLGLSVLLTLDSAFSSFAGEWKLDSVGWWWQEDNGIYPISQWMLINGKEYYFDETGYMLHDTTQDGFQLDSSGARVIPDIGLEVAPYKAELDQILQNNWNYYATYSLINVYDGLGFASSSSWIDCGDYYKLTDVTLTYMFNDGFSEVVKDVGYLDEIRIRKDGIYRYHDGEKINILTLNDWIKAGHVTPRFGVVFDEKGYVIRFSDVNAG